MDKEEKTKIERIERLKAAKVEVLTEAASPVVKKASVVRKGKNMDENNGKPDKETIERLKKMLPAEKKALEILAKNPDYTNYKIGKDLKALGLTNDIGYVSKRLTNSELLRLELSKIRERNAEFLSRRIVPRALDIHEKALKQKVSKDIACSTKDKIVRPGTCENNSTTGPSYNRRFR